jgi:hypothetical protein
LAKTIAAARFYHQVEWCEQQVASRLTPLFFEKGEKRMHPLRKLRESGPHTPADVKRLLAENVVFHSPVLTRAVEGRDKVAAVLAASPTVREGRYLSEYRLEDRVTLLRWGGQIDGHEIESLEILVDDEDGLIVERTIAYRPLPAVMIFRNAMRPLLAGVLSADYWEYAKAAAQS